MKRMRNAKESGFALIELVIVLIILGVLAAVSLPKFVDMGEQARASKLAAVGAAITAGTSTNSVAVAAHSPKGLLFAHSSQGSNCNQATLSKVVNVDWTSVAISEKNGGTGCFVVSGRSALPQPNGTCVLNTAGAPASKAIDVPIQCSFALESESEHESEH